MVRDLPQNDHHQSFDTCEPAGARLHLHPDENQPVYIYARVRWREMAGHTQKPPRWWLELGDQAGAGFRRVFAVEVA